MKINFSQYYQDILFLESLANLPSKNFVLKTKDRSLFLKRLKNFLNLLGNPETKLNFIHVAGTAGKGSTVEILHDLIHNAGFKVGSHTSPFATTTIEKIRLNKKFIPPSELHKIITGQIKPALDKYALKYKTDLPSYFEIFIAICLLYFYQQKCDWVIIEAGLGGMHDATNVIVKPKVTAITNIGLDHMEILGNTKSKIARDKAGIIKPNSLFLTSEADSTIKKLLFSLAKKNKAAAYELKNLAAKFGKSRYFKTKKQTANLNLALNIIDVLKIRPKNPQQVIDDFQLICRQEIMQAKPLVILDGAHNNDKLSNLADFIKTLKYQKLHLILGMAADKKYDLALKKILPLTDNLYLTRFLVSFRKSADLRKLHKDCQKIKKLPTKIYYDPWQALDNCLATAAKNDLIVVAGSFFLAGELRKYWISEEFILTELKIR